MERREITPAEMRAFLTGRASEEVRRRVAADLGDGDGYARKILRGLAAVAPGALDIDWKRLVADGPEESSPLRAGGDGGIPPDGFEPQIRAGVRDALRLAAAGDAHAALALRADLCERAVRHWGEYHRETATLVNGLAQLHYRVGAYAAARTSYERALAIRRRVMGSEHSDTGISLAGLGRTLEALGDYPAALRCHERALAISEREIGPGSPDTGVSLTDLGCALQAVGEPGRARGYFERARDIAETFDGPGDPNTAIATGNLGCALGAAGDLAAAAAHHERAVAILESAYGGGHADIAWALNNLASVLERTGDVGRARAAYVRALEILPEQQGETDFATPACLNNLGALSHRAGDLSAAQAYYDRAVRGYEKLFGAEHPCALVSKLNLAALDRVRGTPPVDSSQTVLWDRTVRMLLGKQYPTPGAGADHYGLLSVPAEGRVVVLNFMLAV